MFVACGVALAWHLLAVVSHQQIPLTLAVFGLDLQVSETFVFRGTKPALAQLLQPEDAHSSRLRLSVEAGSV